MHEVILDAVEIEPDLPVEVPPEDSGCNTLNLNLRTAALSVQLQTKTTHAPVITELNTRLECALSRARDAEERLASAFYRIGFLESQLSEKEKLIATLMK